jgi:spermidine synthase
MRVVAALLFGSGFAALVYQTAWQRMFRLTFGASTAASAAVLAIFLGGLGLGGALLGKRVERSPRPLTYYGNLELGISALAALSPLLGQAAHALYLSLGGTAALGSAGATAVRLLLTTVVIGPAAVLMGGTLPAAARAVVSESDQSRRSLALLYSLNTTGAVVGALVGPLFLFGLLGNQLTLWGAVCINALVGVAARVLGRQGPELTASAVAEAAAHSAGAPPARSETRLAYVAAGLTGFVFLGLELVWFRVLTPLLGGSSLTFGLILACALAGIGLGGYWFSRRSPERPVTFRLLAFTLSLQAVCVLAPFAWGDRIAFVAAHLRPMLNLGFVYLVGGWVVIAAVVVLPASVVSGYQFPALFALLGRGRQHVGEQVGRAYAFNTLGTLSGSLVVGMLLLPSVGAVTLWRGLAQLLALCGAACAGYALSRGERLGSALAPVALSVVALLLSSAAGPGDAFRHSPIGAGRWSLAGHSENAVRSLSRSKDSSIVWSRDGVESSVAIDVASGISFLVNGKSDGAVVQDKGTQAFLGLLPAALHGSVKTAFVVGLGTGMTSGLLSRVPGVERVEVAELEPSVREVAHRSRLANEGALDNPKLRLLIGDGRELLLTSPRRYDVVVSEPSNPYRAGVASLFTREFYEAAASRLEKRGLFAQWLQGYEVDASAVAIAIHTLSAVFPHVSLWSPEGNDLILLGSFEPQVVDVERLRRDLSQPLYLRWLRRAWGMEGPEAVLAHSLAPPAVLARLAARLPREVNRDDVNSLEFAFGRSVGDQRYVVVADLSATLSPGDYRPAVTGSVDWPRVGELRHRVGWQGFRGEQPAPPKAQATISGCDGHMNEAKKLWPAGATPTDAIELWVRAYVAALSGEDAAGALADRLGDAGFLAEQLLVRERWASARGDVALSVAELTRAFAELRRTALPLCDAAARAIKRAVSLAQKHPEQAAPLLRGLGQGPFAVHIEDGFRRRALLDIAAADMSLCLEALGEMRALPAWERPVLKFRANCLRRFGAPDAPLAEADFYEYLSREPSTFADAAGPLQSAAASDD